MPKPTCGDCNRFRPTEASRLPHRARPGRCGVDNFPREGSTFPPAGCRWLVTSRVYTETPPVPEPTRKLPDPPREPGMTFEEDVPPTVSCAVGVLPPGATFLAFGGRPGLVCAPFNISGGRISVVYLDHGKWELLDPATRVYPIHCHVTWRRL